MFVRRLCVVALAAATGLCSEAHAISGVPILMVSPEALDASWSRVIDLAAEERVGVVQTGEVLEGARTLVADRDGSPRVAVVDPSDLPVELQLTLDVRVLTDDLVVVVDPDLVDGALEAVLGGRCRNEPYLAGIVDPSWLAVDTAESMDRRLLVEDRIGLTLVDAVQGGVTPIDPVLTRGMEIAVINPDSVDPGGWCGIGPSPHP